MARYIDADKLIEKYERVIKDPWNKSSAPSSWASAWECVIADIDDIPTADVVPKSEVESIITLNSQLEAQVFDTRKEADILKSTITHKEEEAYTKGYADAKADILEKLQAEVERAETIAKYGDDFYEGKAEGVNAAMNCILSGGEE